MSNANRKRHRKPKDPLDADTLAYYERVASTYNEGFPNDDEKELFLNNVFTQLEDEALSVSQSPIASPIIENLLSSATSSHLCSLLKVFSKDWTLVCKDRNASHVLQGTITALPDKIKDKLENLCVDTLEDSEDPEDYLIKTLISLTEMMLDNIETCINDTYTSHVMRAVIQVLGGVSVDDAVMRSKATRDRDTKGEGTKRTTKFESYPIPKVFKKKLKKFCKAIFGLEDFNILLTDPNVNPVIQTILVVLKKVDVDLCNKYLLKVIMRSRITDTEAVTEHTEVVKLPPVVQDNVGSFLVEQLINLASEDLYKVLINNLFKGRLLQFGLHPSANFVLQKLIKNCPDKDIYVELFDELAKYIEDFLAVNHFGVVVSLAFTCQRLGQRQAEFLQLITEAFHCGEPKERQTKLVPLVASFKAYEMLYPSEENGETSSQTGSPTLTQINYHGSLILQHILEFTSPTMVTNSMLELSPLDLKSLSCNACGSHIVDTLFRSSTVPEKTKTSMLNKMRVVLVDVACDKFGSRVIDCLWKFCTIQQKTIIAGELCGQESKLRGNKFGGYLYHKCALKLFTHRRKDWLEVQGAGVKKRKMFDDIFESGKGKQFKKGKNKKHKKDNPQIKRDTS